MSFVVVKRADPADAVPAGVSAMEEEVARRVRQEVARLRDEAAAAGRAEAEAAARAAAQQAFAAQVEPAAAALREAWTQLAAPLAAQDEAVADLVTELAFSLCRHLLGTGIAADPAALRALVGKLIAEAVAERGPRHSIVLRLHPDDHEALQDVTLVSGAMLLADMSVRRGGAMVEIVEPDGDPIDRIEWDATLEARLGALGEALGLAPRSAATPRAAAAAP